MIKQQAASRLKNFLIFLHSFAYVQMISDISHLYVPILISLKVCISKVKARDASGIHRKTFFTTNSSSAFGLKTISLS